MWSFKGSPGDSNVQPTTAKGHEKSPPCRLHHCSLFSLWTLSSCSSGIYTTKLRLWCLVIFIDWGEVDTPCLQVSWIFPAFPSRTGCRVSPVLTGSSSHFVSSPSYLAWARLICRNSHSAFTQAFDTCSLAPRSQTSTVLPFCPRQSTGMHVVIKTLLVVFSVSRCAYLYRIAFKYIWYFWRLEK